MDSSTTSITDIAQQVLEQEKRQLEAARILLDQFLGRQGSLMVHKARMGGSDSYVGSVTLEWMAQRVGYAHQLPLFTEMDKVQEGEGGSAEPSVTIDDATINEIMQRPLDWSRQAVLAQYLADRQWHKFPPVLVVVTQAWVDDENADEWGEDGRATRASVGFSGLDTHGRVGLLDVSEDYFIYALDGQHRLMGIQGLLELKSKGYLFQRKRDGTASNRKILQEDLRVDAGKLQALGNERIGVEFIAAVLPGETRQDAKRRVRSIFVHVNMMANPLSKGQLAQLDEDNGFAIVARGVAVKHPLLDKDERVDFSNTSISTRSAKVTTLQTLTEMVTHYLRHKYPNWESEKGLVPLRPRDGELDDGLSLFWEIIDHLGQLPSFRRLEEGTPPRDLRNFAGDDPPGEGHMLFRPVGQEALAEALGELVFERGMTLDAIFEKLKKYDEQEGFRMEAPSSTWYMVLYDPNKKRMTVRGRKLAVKLLVYLLGGGIADAEEREGLREWLAEERTYDEDEARGFDGVMVKPKKIELPPAL